MAAPLAGPAVAVTGLAWSTPFGDDLDAVWDRLLAGQGALRETASRFPLRTELAGVVPDLPLDLTATQRQIALAERTLGAAFHAAAIDPARPDVRVVLGTSFGPCLDEPAAALDDWAREAARRVGHPGRPVCVSTACSAGSDGVLVAAQLLRAGVAEICVAGGVDVVTSAKRVGHTALGTMSAGTMRPFDRRHDGMAPGEGAAVLVLERVEHAHRRGAPVLALLRGAGNANDAAGLTAPDPSGESIVLAVRRALADGGLTAQDIAVISAHGTGTPVNDMVEGTGLRRLFEGGPSPVVFATKGALGHSLGATGAIEAVSVVLALRSGKAPPVHGLGEPLPGFPLPLAVAAPVAIDGDIGASLTLGFGGFNTCLLFEAARR